MFVRDERVKVRSVDMDVLEQGRQLLGIEHGRWTWHNNHDIWHSIFY